MVEFGHHAQNDRWAIEVVFPALQGGFFVEAGACGGYLGSASIVLEREFGWKGICVEPVDEYYKGLCRRRSCATDPRCLSGTTGDLVEFLSYPDDPPRSGIRALNKNDSWAQEHGASGETTTKETVTLSDLLEQHQAPPTIHYLCLDVEGAELTILEPFDFESDRRILALSVEGGHCDALLTARGYLQVTNPFAPRRIDHYFVHASLGTQVQDHLID
jgi:FkbM family methyltransferase